MPSKYQKKITVNGKRVTIYGNTKAELNRKVISYKEKKETKKFSHYAEMLEVSWNDLALQTIKSYRPALEVCVEYFGDTDVSDISSMMVIEFLNKIGKTKTKKTCLTYKSMLNQVMNLAVLDRSIDVNPVNVDFKLKGKESSPRQLPDESVVDTIIKYRNEDIFGQMAMIIVCTGTRIVEVLALRWDDIQGNMVRINRSIAHDGNEPYIKEPKTKAGIRTTVLPEWLVDSIPHTNPIFPMLKHHELQRGWGEFCLRHGIAEQRKSSCGHYYIVPFCGYHQLRHKFISDARFKYGIDYKVLESMVGHTKIVDSYYHVDEESLNNAQKILSSFCLPKSD